MNKSPDKLQRNKTKLSIYWSIFVPPLTSREVFSWEEAPGEVQVERLLLRFSRPNIKTWRPSS